MIYSITEDNSRELTKAANELGIKREQIVQIVSNQNGTVSLFYFYGE